MRAIDTEKSRIPIPVQDAKTVIRTLGASSKQGLVQKEIVTTILELYKTDKRARPINLADAIKVINTFTGFTTHSPEQDVVTSLSPELLLLIVNSLGNEMLAQGSDALNIEVMPTADKPQMVISSRLIPSEEITKGEIIRKFSNHEGSIDTDPLFGTNLSRNGKEGSTNIPSRYAIEAVRHLVSGVSYLGREIIEEGGVMWVKVILNLGINSLAEAREIVLKDK